MPSSFIILDEWQISGKKIVVDRDTCMHVIGGRHGGASAASGVHDRDLEVRIWCEFAGSCQEPARRTARFGGSSYSSFPIAF